MMIHFPCPVIPSSPFYLDSSNSVLFIQHIFILCRPSCLLCLFFIVLTVWQSVLFIQHLIILCRPSCLFYLFRLFLLTDTLSFSSNIFSFLSSYLSVFFIILSYRLSLFSLTLFLLFFTLSYSFLLFLTLSYFFLLFIKSLYLGVTFSQDFCFARIYITKYDLGIVCNYELWFSRWI